MEERTFLPVRNDAVFRLFFADERNIEFLRSFLQATLRIPREEYESIEILDPNLLREYADDKLGIIDTKLKLRDGRIIHIEIQKSVTAELKERIVYYDAKLITEQLKSGDDYGSIRQVISIIITDEVMIPSSLRYKHRFTMYDGEAEIEFSNLIEINTLELVKLPAGTDGTELYDWARFIAANIEEELLMVEDSNPVIKKAAVILRELSADERARDLFERREKALRDERMRIRGALKQGLEQGLEQGIQRGIQQGTLRVASKMLAEGMSISEVARLTGLSADELAQVKTE